MAKSIDHVVILVADLEPAIAQYRQLGFTVVPGGRHPIGTHNALIAFEDGSYLELVAFWDPERSDHPWYHFISRGEGVVDYAVDSDELSNDIHALNNEGIEYSGPHPGARSRPDGVEVSWQMAFPTLGNTAGLPFLIQDISERRVRVPDGEDATHSNKATGIDRLIVVASDIDVVVERLAAIPGLVQRSEAPQPFENSIKAKSFSLGEQSIELHQPDPDSPMHARLREKGDGPYAVILRGGNAMEISPDEANGAPLRIETRK